MEVGRHNQDAPSTHLVEVRAALSALFESGLFSDGAHSNSERPSRRLFDTAACQGSTKRQDIRTFVNDYSVPKTLFRKFKGPVRTNREVS